MTNQEQRRLLNYTIDAIEAGGRVDEWGKNLFDLETTMGLPVEIALDELNKNRNFSLFELRGVMIFYGHYLLEHKIKSGITEKRLEDFRGNLSSKMLKFCETGKYD